MTQVAKESLPEDTIAQYSGACEADEQNARDETAASLLDEADTTLHNIQAALIAANDPQVVNLRGRIKIFRLELEGITSYCQQVCGSPGARCGTGSVCMYGIDIKTEMPATFAHDTNAYLKPSNGSAENLGSPAPNKSQTLNSKRQAIANSTYHEFAFGDDVTVEDVGGWEHTSIGNEWTLPVFAKLSNKDTNTKKLAFTVRFEPGTALVMEAYAIAPDGQYWGVDCSKLIALRYEQNMASLDAYEHERNLHAPLETI